MSLAKYKHALLFFRLSIVIPWLLWFVAGYISHQTPNNMTLVSIIGFLGLLAPVFIAYWFILKDKSLKDDLFKRFINFKSIKPIYLFLTIFIMPISILLAQVISLLFGYSSCQFTITGSYTFTSGVFPVLFLLIVAPIIEELAWHTYGTDALRNRFNLLNTSLIFALFWGIWHIPLSSINGYYQSNIVDLGWIHSVNFLVSIFPFVIIMNWLYYKANRNIIVPIVFHITAGYFNEIFATHPDSKIIQTILLAIFALVLIINEKKFFLEKEYNTKSQLL